MLPLGDLRKTVIQKKWRYLKLQDRLSFSLSKASPSFSISIYISKRKAKPIFCKGGISDASPKSQTVSRTHVKVYYRDGRSYVLQISFTLERLFFFFPSMELGILMPHAHCCSNLDVEGYVCMCVFMHITIHTCIGNHLCTSIPCRFCGFGSRPL